MCPRKEKRLTEQEKWRAVRASDKRYDGVFLYGVTSTGIFCRPSCPSKKPKRNTVRFFADADEALRLGFRPCKRCRPDLPEYDPAKAFTTQMKRAMEDSLDDPDALARFMREEAVDGPRCSRVFRKVEGSTPKGYMAALRVERAKKLLRETDCPVLDVALRCGFGSSSHFYRTFREHAAATPGAYRARHGKTEKKEVRPCSFEERHP